MTTVFGSHKLRRTHSRSRDYLRGLGSVFNLSGNTDRDFPSNVDDERLDRVAVESDWKAIGLDLTAAVESYGRRGQR